MSAKTRQRTNIKRKQRAAARLRAESQKAVNAHKAMDEVLKDAVTTLDRTERMLTEAKVIPAVPARAKCPECRTSQKVTKAGVIGKHGECPGAGMPVA